MKFPILFFLIFGFAISLNAQNNFTLNGNIGLGLYGFSKKQETDFTRYRYKEIFEYQAKESVSMGIELAYAYNSKWSFSAGVEYLFFKITKKKHINITTKWVQFILNHIGQTTKK